jgi:Na+(H+)/acetate symporter ActP
MIVIAAVFVPIYHRLKVYTAYEYLEYRFDARVRYLGAVLFLIQRGLAAGITIYAPSIILSTLLGWSLNLTTLSIGSVVIVYTVIGGTRAVSQTQRQQMIVMLGGLGVALGLILWRLPSAVTTLEAVKLAVALGNDVNAHADFGNYPMTGDTAYTLLYYPLNIDDLLELGVGDPRWSGSTPMIGAVVSGQTSIVSWLLEHGAHPDEKTKLGWTPLLVAEGVFFANAKKEFPQAAEIIRKASRQ